jgi:hypothetical protein
MGPIRALGVPQPQSHSKNKRKRAISTWENCRKVFALCGPLPSSSGLGQILSHTPDPLFMGSLAPLAISYSSGTIDKGVQLLRCRIQDKAKKH